MYLSILSTPFYFTCLDGAELLKLRCYVIGHSTFKHALRVARYPSFSIKTLVS